MAKRQDLIYEKVKELSQIAVEEGKEPGVTAQEMSELLKMDRGNVSKEMNLLAAAGKLVKYEGRPVRFSEKEFCEQYLFDRKNQESILEEHTETSQAFERIIGREGSLKMQIKQVKAAMLYPPNGLHTLLNGPTGTGKTMFAQKMYEYAKHMNMLKPDAEFVIFNCAEYAENSQLIVSQIFGHKKGAFTGADRDKSGLIERADGGILFLDEIHRLPPEGQEMLFSLMDYGKYRRLGETERSRTAQVLIIGATTEKLEDVLLKTFMRRMPLAIQLPPLNKRPLLERLELLEMFLAEEQKKISVSIKISKETVLSFLLYECTANIGQMKLDVQLLCARAFWEYKVGGKQMMELDQKLLPFYIEQGFYKASDSRNALVQFLIHGEEWYAFPVVHDEEDFKSNVISKKYLIFHKFYSDQKEVDMERGIDTYISSLLEKENGERNAFSGDALNKVITGKVYYAVEEAIEFAEMRLKRRLSDNIKMGFALHVNALLEGLDKKTDIRKENLEGIITEHPREAKVAKLILTILEEELGIKITRGEIGYTTMFLCADEVDQERKKIGTIVLAHGDHTATSIADAVNQLLDTTHCRGINMPLSAKVEDVYRKTVQLVTEMNEGRGVLLLVDMGSLNMFAERIAEETGIQVQSLGMVSTLTVLEAVRKCMSNDVELPEVIEYLECMMIHMLEEQKTKLKTDREQQRIRAVILVTCMSGMGAAYRIAEMVRAITGLEEGDTIGICCVGADGMSEEGSYLAGYPEKEVLAVIGTADLQLDMIPYISVDEIVAGAGIERIEKLIDGSRVGNTDREKKRRAIDEHVLAEAMKELLEFLDAEKMVSMVLQGFKECTEKMDITEQEEKIVRYTIHVACMIERLLRREMLPYKEIDKIKVKCQKEFQIVDEVLESLEALFQIEIPDTEKAYIVELLKGEVE